MYSVDEGAGVVTVAVAVFNGSDVFTSGVMQTIEVQLTTQPGTALGMKNNQVLAHFIQHFALSLSH